jgi:hypothetical protein
MWNRGRIRGKVKVTCVAGQSTRLEIWAAVAGGGGVIGWISDKKGGCFRWVEYCICELS